MNVLPTAFLVGMMLCLYLAARPPVGRSKWLGLLGAVVCFLLIGVTSPKQQRAEREARAEPEDAVETRSSGSESSARSSVSTQSAPDVHSTSRSMSFETCLQTIREVGSELGVAPINIVETSIVRVVRFNTVDGSVLVTCSAPDRKMVITRSPYQG